MKTELDLLAEALQRLNLHYRQRDQQLDQRLNDLAAQVERLARHVDSSNAYVSKVSAHLTRSQEQQLTALAGQLEQLARQVNGLTAPVANLTTQLKRLPGG